MAKAHRRLVAMFTGLPETEIHAATRRMSMKKWRTRLHDLNQLLLQAESTYFDPNLFRLNINNAIQTSRTITFLIQKEKKAIPEFDSWYQKNVTEPFAQSKVMTWLKNARNTIEKEGDLETASYWKAQLLFSYTEAGPEITADTHEGLFMQLRIMRKRAQALIPPGIYNDSAIVIDRKWVANSLPEFELIDAVTYGYYSLKRVVDALDDYLGEPKASEPSGEGVLFASQMRRAFVKLSTGQLYNLRSDTHVNYRSDEFPQEIVARFKEFDMSFFDQSRSLTERVSTLANVAARLMKSDGYHITVGFLFSRSPPGLKVLSPKFDDYVDKLIFWHELAYAVKLLSISSVLWVSEGWTRDARLIGHQSMASLPIVGEFLQVIGASDDGAVSSCKYTVTRQNGQPSLSLAEEENVRQWNFLVPLRRAWGLSD